MKIRIPLRSVTMTHLIQPLREELGERKALEVWRWYLAAYGLEPDSVAPDRVREEILGR